MKKTSIFFAIATIALFSACRKENFNATESTPGAVTVIGVGINDVKTTMGAPVEGTRKIYWANGDSLRANDLTSAALADLPEKCTSARFTFDGTLTYPANLLYPADYYKDESTITLPLEQPVTPKVALYGYMGEEGDAQMNALLAYVHIPLTQGEDKDEIKAMTVESLTDGYCLSGDFTIDYETGALTPAAEASKKVSVLFNKPLNPEKATDFFAAVPAGENVKLSVKFKDVKGHCMTKTVTRTFAAGKVVSLPETEFVPTTTEFDVVITTAAQLVQFAKDYNDGKFNNPIVQLGSDIVSNIVFDETTSAQFNETGGIGTPDNGHGDTNYFNGVFDGNNHTISGLEATVPVFAYTGGGGDIKDLTLSSTCSYTVGTDSGSNHGALVGRNKGTVKDCTSNANVIINNIQDVSSANQLYGGLVGYNLGGKIDGCTVTGNITCSQTGQTITTTEANYASIGGIAGYMSDDGGTINDCKFQGNITVSDATTYGGITANKIYFYVGGIVGYANNGVISSCNSGSSTVANKMDVRGALVPALGGIAGWIKLAEKSEISNCTNYMSLNFTSNGARDVTTPARLGGISSRSVAPIKGSYNYGCIATICNSTSLYLGGIVGDGTDVSDCINYEGGTITRTNQLSTAQANRYMMVGGIMGANNAAGDVKNCENKAEVNCNALGASTALTLDMGGIIGCASKQVDISHCNNSGKISFDDASSTTIYKRIAVGGVLGIGQAENTTIVSCSNSGQVYPRFRNKIDTRPTYVGGIVGVLAGLDNDTDKNLVGAAGFEIASCSNTGEILPYGYNTTQKTFPSTPMGGCIVGVILGTSGSRASVHDCTVSGNRMYVYRGIAGGVAGYASYADLTKNTVSNQIAGNGNAEANGGIVGWAVNSSITECEFSGSMSGVTKIGGIAAYLDNGSSVSKCKVNGATITKGANAAAVLVFEAASGVTISNCGVKGSLDGKDITLSSNMITTDGGATVTGTYLIKP